jgi:hypothetical protein
MHAEISLLEVVFRLTVFSFLAYKLYDLGRLYVYPLFIQQIVRERNQQRELLEKDNLLTSTRHRFETQVYNQRKMFTLLERNVQNWRNGLQESYNAQEQRYLRMVEALRNKRQEQQHNLELQKTVAVVVPDAVQRARRQLTERYKGPAGQVLMQHMIQRLVTTSTQTTKNGLQ